MGSVPAPPRLRPLLWPVLALTLLAGALPHLSAPAAQAQGEHPTAYQSTLDQVEALTGADATLKLQRTPDGTTFVDLQGRRKLVLLVRRDALGNLITRCVGSVEEAAAFLSGSPPVFAEPISAADAAVERLIERGPALSGTAAAAGQTTITVTVQDGPGEGFNDATSATPVGGNAGTTVGAQRLIAFQHAANVWAAAIQSPVPIMIDARFDPLDCRILGAAGPQLLISDFTPTGNSPGPEHQHTLYVEALANKRAGYDLSVNSNDIDATFNSAIGTAGCPGSGSWYYGLDNQEPQGTVDLVAVLLHEIGHGLGFISLIGTSPGTYGRNLPYDPLPTNNQDDIWNYFLYDNSVGKLFKDMSVAERSVAITHTNALVWGGPAVTSAVGDQLTASPYLSIVAPPTVSGPYTIGGASFGAQPANPPLSAGLAAATDADSDGAGGDTIFDACSAIDNPATLAGKIALIDRGGCAFTVKVKHAQDAGAIAAIIANNQPGGPPAMGGSDPTIAIVALSISQADGAALRAALASFAVPAQIGLDTSRRAGADSAGRALMYAPVTIASGSSVSHFDVSATPNLLMEPSINPDIGQRLDLTDELLRDIGWYADLNYNGAPDPDELDLSLSQTAAPKSRLRLGSEVTLTLTLASSGLLGASAAHLVDQFPAQLGQISWTASYSGGASGPPDGSGDIDLTLAMAPGSQAIIQVRATIVSQDLTITNTAGVTSGGPEIDIVTSNNQATVVLSQATDFLYLPVVAR